MPYRYRGRGLTYEQVAAIIQMRDRWLKRDWDKYEDLKQEAENEKQYSREDTEET